MEKNKNDTMRLDVMNVDRTVCEAFKGFVVQRHGKLRGALSEEVTQAMAEYLSNHAHTHEEEEKEKEKEMQMSVGQKRLMQVEENLDSQGMLDALKNGEPVYPAAIENIIRSTVGLDKRTVAKYYTAFCNRYDLMKDAHGILRR